MVWTDAKTTAFALIGYTEHTNMKPKNTICLWFDKDAQEAASFYAATFPDSKVIAVHKAPADYPDGKKGDVLTVEFTVLGIPCLGLNGGPAFKHSEAFSFQIATDNQEETDRYWNARSEEHTSELQSSQISYAVFCLKKKTQRQCH